MSKKANIKDMSTQQKKYVMLLCAIGILIIIFSFISPAFLNIRTFMNLIIQSSAIMIISVGMTFVIITGNIDLSVGAILAVSGVAGAMVVSGFPDHSVVGAVAGIAATILTGAVFGLFNGFVVGICKVNAFMTTLATMTLARGLALVLCGDSRVAVNNNIYNYLAQGKIGILPGVTILLIILMPVGYILLDKTVLGRKTYAVGGNSRAVEAMGIHSGLQVVTVFVMNGVLCGIAAIVTVGRSLSAQPLVGLNLEFEIITAVVIGGTSLMGGVGTFTGTLLGAIMMSIITTGLGMMNIPISFNYLLKGILILAAVYFDIVTSKDMVKKNKNIKESMKEKVIAQNHQYEKLQLKGINKNFPGVKALDGVDLTIERGKVHALVGENGAGKSTLMKILAGVYTKDAGEILIDGRPIEIRSPMDSQAMGISVIYQELELVPELSVYNNIFLGKEIVKKNSVLFDTNAMRKKASEMLERFGLHINVQQSANSFTVGQRQMFEIVKAIGSNLSILVMDEPTASITNADKDTLFDTIRQLKEQGVGIVYISHRMQEIFEIADEVTVLRDGKHVITAPIDKVDEEKLVKYMVDRSLTNIYGREHLEPGKAVLEVRNLTKKGVFKNISFTLHEGEVLGFSGLIGAGRSEIMRCIFGLDQYDEGEIYLNGEKVSVKTPAEAVRKGIAFVTEDRRGEGIIPLMSVGDNIAFTVIKDISTFGWVNEKEVKKVAEKYVDKLNVATPSIRQNIGNLSGGNQQKCCIAKWLATNPKIIILDEPTKGIDIGAKEEIHKIIDQLVKENYAVIIISSELPEVIGASDRIIVMYEGEISGEYSHNDGEITQDMLMTSAAGVKSA